MKHGIGLIDKKINLKSVAEYIQYTTVHAPNTILQDVLMLMPGHILEFKIQNSSFNILIMELIKYFYLSITSKALFLSE